MCTARVWILHSQLIRRRVLSLRRRRRARAQPAPEEKSLTALHDVWLDWLACERKKTASSTRRRRRRRAGRPSLIFTLAFSLSLSPLFLVPPPRRARSLRPDECVCVIKKVDEGGEIKQMHFNAQHYTQKINKSRTLSQRKSNPAPTVCFADEFDKYKKSFFTAQMFCAFVAETAKVTKWPITAVIPWDGL